MNRIEQKTQRTENEILNQLYVVVEELNALEVIPSVRALLLLQHIHRLVCEYFELTKQAALSVNNS